MSFTFELSTCWSVACSVNWFRHIDYLVVYQEYRKDMSVVLIYNVYPYIIQDVDQETGQDLNPERTRRLNVVAEDDETAARNPDRPSTVPLVQMPDMDEMHVSVKVAS